MGYGRGRGFGGFFPESPDDLGRSPAPLSKDEERKFLERSMEDMESEMIRIKSRLKELAKE